MPPGPRNANDKWGSDEPS